MEKMPQYVPSSEEMKKAEEAMTPTQRGESKYREQGFEQLEEMGAENIDKAMLDQVMKLKKEKGSNVLEDVISGELDGHDILIKAERIIGQIGDYKATLCSIDGKETSSEVAQRLLDKIYVINEFIRENSNQAAIIKEELKEFVDADEIAEGLLAKM